MEEDDRPRRPRRTRAERDADAEPARPARKPRARRRPADDDDLVGPRRSAGRAAGARRAAADDDDLVGARRVGPPSAGRPRRGGRDVFAGIVRDLPNFVKLLTRLMRDPRVSRVDKAIVGAVLVYLVIPEDAIPDFAVPVLGQIEDVYLLALALSRLLNHAGTEVLLDNWDGDVENLEAALAALDRASSILPGPVRLLLGKRPA